MGQGSSLGKLEDEDALDRGRDHRPKGGGGRKNRDEISDVPRTRHLGASCYLTVGLDSKEWVGCGMLFVGYQHRGSNRSHGSA